MSLLVFLLAYIIRRKLDSADHLNSSQFWRTYFAGGRRATAGSEHQIWRGLLRVLLPAALLAGAQILTAGDDAFLWVMLAPLEVLLLVVIMGVPGLGRLLERYAADWRRGDMQAAWYTIKNELPDADRGDALAPDRMHRLFSEVVLFRLFEAYFAIAFWYFIGGIAAGFAAAGILALREHWPQAAARARYQTLSEVINWVPVRLLVMTFGLAGDLSGWMKQGIGSMLKMSNAAKDAIVSAASAALTGYALDPDQFSRMHPDAWPDFGERSLQAIRDLLNRSMLVWICVVAILTIAGLG